MAAPPIGGATSTLPVIALAGFGGDAGRTRCHHYQHVGAATTGTATTIMGAAPGTNLRRFLVGPKESEITGIDTTPDGRRVFVNIQHPGEDYGPGFPNTFWSNWPASQTNPTAVSRPRSATIVITKDDGGVVGL